MKALLQLLAISAIALGCSSAKPPKPVAPAVSAADESAAQARKLSAAGNWQSASGQWQSALERYRLLNDRTNEAIALHNLAGAKQQTGDLKTAHDLFESAAALNSSLKSDEQWWHNQVALLQVEAQAGSTNELTTRFEKLNGLLGKVNNRQIKALYANERGLWNSGNGNFGPAAADFAQALQWFRAEKDESGIATVMANEALLLERQSKFTEAAEAWRLAQNAFESLANPIGIAVSMTGRGRSLLAAKQDLPLAEDLLRRAARNFRVLHAESQMHDAEKLLTKALELRPTKL